MRKNNFRSAFCSCVAAAVMMMLLLLQACADEKVAGERADVFYASSDAALSGADAQQNFVADVEDAAPVSEWIMDGGNLAKECKNIAIANASGNLYLREKWSADIGRFGKKLEYISAPVVFDGKIFALSADGKLFAFDLKTGDEIFSKVFSGGACSESGYSAHAGYAGLGIDADSGLLFAGLPDGNVSAVSINDNYSEHWSKKLDYALVGAPIISGDIVVVMTKSVLYGLDKNTGKILWDLKTLAEMVTMTKSASVAVADGKVFATMPNSEMYILELKTGKVMFADSLIGKYGSSSPMSLVGAIANPVVSDKNGLVFVGNTDSRFTFIPFKNNKFSERVDGKYFDYAAREGSMPFGIHSTPCLNNDVIFAATNSGGLIAMKIKSAKDAAILWTADLKNDDDFYVLGTLLVNGNLIVNTNTGDVITIDAASGKILKRQSVESKFISPMIAAGDNIIAINGAGDVVVYEYKN